MTETSPAKSADPMVLTINGGSSSIKFALYEMQGFKVEAPSADSTPCSRCGWKQTSRRFKVKVTFRRHFRILKREQLKQA